MDPRNFKVQNKGRRVKVQTVDGKSVSGCLNILGYDRLSDYLLKHVEDFVMLYDGGIDQNKTMFLLKKNIVFIEDIDGNKG